MPVRSGVTLTRLFEEHRLNAILAWGGCGVLAGLAIWEIARGNVRWGIFVLFVATLAILPGPFYRSLTTTLPWELIGLITAAAGWRFFVPGSELALYGVTAGAAVVIATELHLFTATRMNHRFVVMLVAVSTAAVAGGWALLSWAADVYLGTNYITTNAELMGDFLAAAIAGVIVGILFDLYVRWWETRIDRLTPVFATQEEWDPDER